MPLYHFNIADAHPAIPCEGIWLDSIQAARCHALKYAGEVLCDQVQSFWNDDDWVLTVSDEDHLTLFVVTVCTSDTRAGGQPSRGTFTPIKRLKFITIADGG